MLRLDATWSSSPVATPVRLTWLLGLVAAAAFPGPPAAAAVVTQDPESRLGRTVSVPFDHERPGDGRFDLYYELGAPFDPALPTVLLVADGQQFSLREGRIAEIAARRFGPGVNVVGVPGRAAAPAEVAKVNARGDTDWQEAYRLLRSRQWCGDLDRVRHELVREPDLFLEDTLLFEPGTATVVPALASRYPLLHWRAPPSWTS